jgi:glycosyltransferase involved in cell wall biosynthesis
LHGIEEMAPVMAVPSVSIVLATYNASSYLQQQLDSLAGQSHLPVELIVGDDGSLDETRLIVEAFARTSPFVVHWVHPCKEPLGACQNFARLLELAHGEYLMFCDQDDIWLEDKIRITLEEMQRLEAMYTRETPCLVYTDLAVISADAQEIAPSFWRYQRFKPQQGGPLQVVVAQNVVTGCTTMVNRTAQKLVVPMPRHGPLMHDWWFTLAVSAFGGQVRGLDRPTVLYRQHSHNTVGARSWSQRILSRMLTAGRGTRDELRATQEQAAVFLEHFGSAIPSGSRMLIQAYAQLSNLGFVNRRIVLWRHRIHKMGWHRTAGLYLSV